MQRPTAPVPAQNPLQSSIADNMMNEPTLTVQCRGQMMSQEVRVSLDSCGWEYRLSTCYKNQRLTATEIDREATHSPLRRRWPFWPSVTWVLQKHVDEVPCSAVHEKNRIDRLKLSLVCPAEKERAEEKYWSIRTHQRTSLATSPCFTTLRAHHMSRRRRVEARSAMAQDFVL